MFDQIIELQNTQDAIYRAALEELQRRLQFEEKKKQCESEVRRRHRGLPGVKVGVSRHRNPDTSNLPAEGFKSHCAHTCPWSPEAVLAAPGDWSPSLSPTRETT